MTWLFERDNTPGSIQMRENRKYAREAAKELIDAKRENMRNGELGRDVLSLLSECFPGCRWRSVDWLPIERFEQLRGAGMSMVK